METNIDQKQVNFWTDDMLVFLNYQEAEFEFIIDPATMQSDVKYYQELLNKNAQPIHFEGKYTLNRIPLEKHSNKTFDVFGSVASTTKDNLFEGDGNIYHLNNALYSSLVTLNLQMKLDQMGLKELFPSAINTVEISIKHTIPEDQF